MTLCLMSPVAAKAASSADDTFTTGRDWVQHMTKREKFISLLPPTLVFSRHDVEPHHTIPEYIYWIDKILLKNPQLEKEDVGNIFASTVYLVEPENRDALKNMEAGFLRGDYEDRSTRWPRLSIDEVLQEISPES